MTTYAPTYPQKSTRRSQPRSWRELIQAQADADPALAAAMREHIAAALVGAPYDDWRSWLAAHFPAYTSAPMSPRHAALWTWFAGLTPGVKPPARIEIWARGGAKSSTAELGATYTGCRAARRFALYVSGAQSQADKHVQSIAALLEQLGIARAVNKYNQSKGWTQQILRAANGFNIVSLGLDAGVRGVKLDQYRPDLIILDDVDNRHDSAAVVAKKIETITESILPTGAPDYAVLFIQNMVHKDSVAAQLIDGRAAFLLDRDAPTVEPAVRALTYEQRDGKFIVTGGMPTWEGQSLTVCQSQINDWGLTAFLSEAQHEVDEPDGGMYSHLAWRRCAWRDVPPLVRTCVWCDPAVTNTDDSDCHGVQADGIGADGTIYRLFSWEQRTTPQDVLCRALLKALELGAQVVGVETDQGGDTWQSVFNEAWRTLIGDGDGPMQARFRELNAAHRARQEAAGVAPRDLDCPAFRSAKAGQGHGSKIERGSKMLADYERGRIVHVEGTHLVLEKALRRFPKAKPFDLHDACFWSWNWLSGGGISNSAVGAFG